MEPELEPRDHFGQRLFRAVRSNAMEIDHVADFVQAQTQVWSALAG